MRNTYAIDNNGNKVKLGDIVECLGVNSIPITNSRKLGVVTNVINETNICINGLNSRHNGARFTKFIKHTDQSLPINNSIAYDKLIRKKAINIHEHLQDIVISYKKACSCPISEATFSKYQKLQTKYTDMLRSNKLKDLLEN